MNKFYNFARNEAGERELRIEGMITDDNFLAWLIGGTSAKTFRAELNSGEGDITVWINSEGGDCFAATSIYNALKEYRGKVTIKIDALAASAASVIAMAGDSVEISHVGMIMIHNPWSFAEGDSAEMKSVAAMLDEVKETILNAYELNTKLSREEISRLMDEETFMHAQRAVELGFADKIIGNFEGYIRGITDAYVKGEYDDPEFIALRKYGAEITDATGRLKNFADITEEVYQAWKKADEAGEGIEFLQLTGGEAGVRDAIQLFKRYEEAKEDAAKIYDANLDGDQLHELDRTLNLVEEQTKELKNALGNLFVPAAQSAGEKFFQMLHDGTEYLTENKDAIQKWGFVAAETFSTISEKLSELTSYQMPNTGDEKVDKMLDGLQWQQSAFNEQALWGDNSPWSKIFSKLPRDLFSGIVERATRNQKAYNSELEETATVSGKVAAGLEALAESQKKVADKNPLNQYDWKRINAFKEELEDLRIELDFADNDYEKALAQLELWKQRERGAKNFLSDAEREAIENLYAAKLEQIEQDRADKLAEIRESIASADKTALEQKLDSIEKEKEEWLKAGMEEAEATKLAQKQLSDYIKKTAEDLSNSLTSLYNTELENRLEQIEKERQAWIDKCGDEVKATELAEQAKADAQRNAAMSVLRQQAEEYEAFQQGGYAGLRAYKANKLEEQGVNSDYLYMTPQQLEEFQKASQVAEKSLMPNFMTDHDRAEHYQQMQNWNDWKAARVEADKQQNYAIVNGVKVGLKEALGDTPIEISLGKNGKEEAHNLRVSPEGDSYIKKDSRYSYDKKGRETESQTQVREGYLPVIQEPKTQQYEPENYSDISQPLIESFSEIPQAVQGATTALNEIPTAVQGISESLSEMAEPQFDSSINPFSEIETEIQSVIESFSGMNNGFSEVTVRLSDLSQALANFSLPETQAAEQRQPVNVSTTVQIDEAHAWDYDHIQELAEKVAAIIKPEIINAIGGDSNSY